MRTAQRVQHAYAKSKFHHSFWWSRRMSWERVGPGQTHIAILPQCMTIDISCERVAFRGHQSTLPCRSKRKVRIKVVGVCRKLISTCVFTSATSHLHIPTSRIQKKDFCLDLYISSALHLHMAYIRLVAVLKKILSTCVFEFESALERLSVRFMFASTPVYINFIL